MKDKIAKAYPQTIGDFGKPRDQLIAERDAARAEVAQLTAAIPNRCPVTNLPFFMLIHHDDLGLVPTYGGPYDSYTIPEAEDSDEPLCNRSLIRWRFCHDRGHWIEAESINIRLIYEADLIELQEGQVTQ